MPAKRVKCKMKKNAKVKWNMSPYYSIHRYTTSRNPRKTVKLRSSRLLIGRRDTEVMPII
jgi:hypothetical protein